MGCAPRNLGLRRSLAVAAGADAANTALPIRDQVSEINAVLRGHYAYYGIAGNLPVAAQGVSGRGALLAQNAVQPQLGRRRLTWDVFNQIKERTPLLRPKLRLPYRELQALAVL